MTIRLLIVGLALFVATGAAQQRRLPDRLLPVDEGPKDLSFVVFRSELIKAARARDLAKVRLMMVPQPKTHDTGDEATAGNLQRFERRWKLRTAPNEFLDSLVDVLEHGGRFWAPDHFVAPYWYTEFPDDDLAWWTHDVVIRDAAPIFAKPDARSEPIETVSYAVLRTAIGPSGWTSVKLSDGREGYIQERHLRDPSGARAHFRKINAQWKLAIFAAGMD